MSFPRRGPGAQDLVPRYPPARDLPADDRSLLHLLYRKIPFPNTEWWWLCGVLELCSATGARKRVSLIANVQLNAALYGCDPLPVFAITLRDLEGTAHYSYGTRGAFFGGASYCFEADGVRFARADPSSPSFDEELLAAGVSAEHSEEARTQGLCSLHVRRHNFSIELFLFGQSMTIPGKRGWIDYDPDGPFPFWGTSKLRLYRPSGSLRLGENAEGPWEVVGGSVHFEQQCLLLSATLPLMAHSMLQPLVALDQWRRLGPPGFKWHYYTASFEGKLLVFLFMWSSKTGRILKESGIVTWGSGEHAAASEWRFEPSRYYYRRNIGIPERATLEFKFEQGPLEGWSRLDVEHSPSTDWFVPYHLSFNLVCYAHEATCTARLTNERIGTIELFVNQETIDCERGVVMEDHD